MLNYQCRRVMPVPTPTELTVCFYLITMIEEVHSLEAHVQAELAAGEKNDDPEVLLANELDSSITAEELTRFKGSASARYSSFLGLPNALEEKQQEVCPWRFSSLLCFVMFFFSLSFVLARYFYVLSFSF